MCYHGGWDILITTKVLERNEVLGKEALGEAGTTIGRCLKQFVVSVAKTAEYLLDRLAVNRCYVVNVSRKVAVEAGEGTIHEEVHSLKQ